MAPGDQVESSTWTAWRCAGCWRGTGVLRVTALTVRICALTLSPGAPFAWDAVPTLDLAERRAQAPAGMLSSPPFPASRVGSWCDQPPRGQSYPHSG